MMEQKNGLRQRLFRGLGAQGVSQAVQIFIRLAEVPLFLYFWGPQGYGEWLIVAAIPAYLAIADGGFSAAATRDMSMRSAAGNQSGALAVYQSTWLFLLGMSVLIGVAAYVTFDALPLAVWLDFQFIDSSSINFVLLLLVAHVLVGFQGGLINGGFWCSGRYPFGMLLSANASLIEFSALAITVALGGGAVAAAGAFLGGRFLGTLLSWYALRSATPWLHFGWKRASTKEIRRLTAPAFASLAFPLGNALNIQGMRLVVGIVLGPAAVAVFSPIRTLSRLAMQPRAIINQLMQPEMAFAYGQGDTSKFGILFLRSCQLAFWGALTASVILAIVGTTLFGVWTNHQVVMHWPLFTLLLLSAIVDGVWYSALMVMYATNRHGLAAIYYLLVYGLCSFALAFVAADFWGLTGIGVVLLVVDVAMLFYILSTALHCTGYRWKRWARSVASPPLFIIAFLVSSGVEVNNPRTQEKPQRKHSS